MPLFRSQKATSFFPSDIVRKMELYGQFEFDSQSVDSAVATMVGQMLSELYPKAAASPDSFISEVAARCFHIAGGRSMAANGSSRI